MKEKEAIEKGIDLETLRQEQKKLAKTLSLKDEFDFNSAIRFAGIDIVFIQERKELVAVIVVLDENMEVIEEKYAQERINFPYIPGFRAYRELPVMLKAIEKLNEVPDVIFVLGQGIAHPQGLGIASHLGLALGKPTIGIAKSLVIGQEENDEVKIGNKVVAKKIQTHEGSKPIFISQGNLISLNTAIELTKKCLKEPHKLPEPLVRARRYLDRICKELK